MTEYIVKYMPWFLSAISIGMTIMAGNLHKKAWLFGLVAQVFWSVWIMCSENYGFIPQNVLFYGVYIRNHLRWSKLNLQETKT